MSKCQSLCMAIVCLVMSGMIYLLYRCTDVYMFQPLKTYGVMDYLLEIRKYVATDCLPDWFLYSLPDGLWLYSYMLFVRVIWYGNNSAFKLFFLALMPIMAFALEGLQFIHCFPGTGDIVDIVFYLAAVVLYVLF